MRVVAGLVVSAVAGIVAASLLTHGTRAANPKLIGTVGPGYTITLTDANGTAVTSLAPGTYDIEVHDESEIHNFDLIGPGGTSVQKTVVEDTGVVTWTVTLTAGTWKFQCDPHSDYMSGSVAVTSAPPAGTTTAGTTTTPTTSAGTTTAPNTTQPAPPTPTTTVDPPTVSRVARCVVPPLRGRNVVVARRQLKRRHCALGRIRSVNSRVRRGLIVSQRPRAGASRPAGTRVNVSVSRGRR